MDVESPNISLCSWRIFKNVYFVVGNLANGVTLIHVENKETKHNLLTRKAGYINKTTVLVPTGIRNILNKYKFLVKLSNCLVRIIIVSNLVLQLQCLRNKQRIFFCKKNTYLF